MSTISMNIHLREAQFMSSEVSKHLQPTLNIKRKLSGDLQPLDHFKHHLTFFSETQGYRDAQHYVTSSGRRCAVGHIFDSVLSTHEKRP
ncbi:hypothetical protein K7432_008599 [Basidiobolus ranarum]|uniref:Uncharacterized protein n=1 Tax=Basidiobolus ranarum TaxID=34480 RepID=A0ABR2VYB4_9FUNG